MYVSSVRLVNYKSIGDYDENEIILEPKITTVIGKNETGKSNVVEGMSKIKFRFINGSAFENDIVNRNSPTKTEIKYIIKLKPSQEDVALGIKNETAINLTKNKGVVSGEMVEYYHKNIDDLVIEIIQFLNGLGNNPLQLQQEEFQEFKILVSEMLNLNYFDLYNISRFLNIMEKRRSYLQPVNRLQLKEYSDLLKKKWNYILDRFPVFFYRKNNKTLNSTYTINEVEQELKKEYNTSLLKDFLRLINVDKDDFLAAVRTSTEARAESLRMRINRNIEKHINVNFRKFYNTEDICLSLGFNNNSVSFLVQTGEGEGLKLSERSNGLKWYLETFIDAQANDVTSKNIVYLFDEPGISLHINAQQELQGLFKYLVEQGNQVVYTTHLPNMLDLEEGGIHRIRAVVKDNEGFTKIYKTAYDSKIAPNHQQDTLAPLVNAIGMSLNTTFGPAYGRLNIVTEGMSDYIYLKMMAGVLGLELDKWVFIPSVGAENCINICNILEGWGCKFKALFDYDGEGVKAGEKMRNKLGYQLGANYCYLKDVSQSDIDESTFMTEKCMIEDLVTASELNKFCDEYKLGKNIGKTLIAKLMSDAVAKESYQLGTECKNNFRELFSRILI